MLIFWESNLGISIENLILSLLPLDHGLSIVQYSLQMDRDMQKRVVSKKRPINQKQHTSLSSPSTSSNPRKTQKKRPSKRVGATPPEEKFYTARRILDEEYRHGTLYYLVDWADDEETGEAYEPTWVCSRVSEGHVMIPENP